MAIVTISQQKKRIEIDGFDIDNPLIFEFFNSTPASERDEKLIRAISIGVLAIAEDRISSFLATTKNELGTELESLKLIFDMKQEVFLKSSAKGVEAENSVLNYLDHFLKSNNLPDEAILTGNMSGKIAKNKTGDIVSYLNGKEDTTIAIEVKFDKNIRLGDISTRDIFSNKTDTAWSQLIESQANRDSRVGIIVFDVSTVDNSISKFVENVRYIPQVGFVTIVDQQRGDYSNLGIAYSLARDIAINAKETKFDKDLLSIIINRIIKGISDITSIRSLINQNIEHNKKIIAQIEKSLLSIEFSQAFLAKFLSTGSLTKEDLLDFYYGDDVRDKFKSIEKDIKEI
ncbi:hypothetical protein [Thalassospira povalilytica]|uniref:hypothetical protein n=1 Tax=Thalassospira povalilytica TaxID=732237 RepID=UPI001D18E1D3|nr:hypothetical protein [Thalassospira povalilytica]MCC4242752.1 hypothetical protein [Thalassospira povalilytica]